MNHPEREIHKNLLTVFVLKDYLSMQILHQQQTYQAYSPKSQLHPLKGLPQQSPIQLG